MRLGLVFDLDGTLVHSAPDLHAVANRLLAERGRPPLDLPTVTGFVGEGASVLVARCFAATGAPLDAAGVEEAVIRYRELYHQAPTELTRPYPYVPEVLEELGARFPLAVCTNKPEALAHAVLEGTGLARRFAAVVGGDTLPVRKPDPAMLRCAGERLGAAELVFVGDSEVDAAAAAGAGVPFLWFEGGYHHGEVAGWRARFTDWRDLPGLL
jgi:phosphoglycolate phosphatase